jgi:hypothetical protein
VEDVHYGEIGSNRLLDRIVNCGHSWCLRGSLVSCCHAISLAGLYIDLNLCDTIKNG